MSTFVGTLLSIFYVFSRISTVVINIDLKQIGLFLYLPT